MSATAATAPAPSLAIECRGLRKVYDDVVAVDSIDLAVPKGQCFGLLGPNGAGKTTTVEILEGLVAPTAGDVRVLGMRWSSDEASLRARIGVALQETQLMGRLTVEETVDLFRSFYGARARATRDVLADVALEEKRRAWVQKLSGGQRQRLALACALVGDPEVLFLDEPTTGLDPQSRRQLWDLVLAYRARGGTIVLTTHYMDEAERLCDRVSIVDHGRVIEEGTPRQLIAGLGGDHVIEFELALPDAELATAVDLPSLAALPAVQDARREGPTFALAAAEPHRTLPALLSHLSSRSHVLTRLATRQATLEDVFVKRTGRTLRDA